MKITDVTIRTKLILLLSVPLLILLVVFITTQVQSRNTSNFINILNKDIFEAQTLFLDSDKDIYQILTAFNDIRNSKTEEEYNKAIKTFEKNQNDVSTRVAEGYKILSSHDSEVITFKGEETSLNYKELHEQFITDFGKWNSTFDINTKAIIDESGFNNYFESSRTALNELGGIAEYYKINKIEQLNAKTRQSMYFMISIFLFLFIATVIFGTLLISNIKHPVVKIINFVEMLSSGDLSVRLDLKQNDEFGIISRALNTSTLNLETLISEIINSAENVNKTVGQIATGNSDLSRRTSQQASALEEIAATIEENTSQVARNAENASVAQNLTQDGADKSSMGSKQAVAAIDSINEINESSKKISEIITVINEIAFQTNLLALNAAVEAARAGDQGKGFAVVAGEVRNLAQRSGTAAKEIEQLIKESVNKVEAGTHQVVQTGDFLKEIAKSARTGADLLSEVAAASSEQMAGMLEINKAINELDSMTQENSALVEETSSASEEMSLQAGEMLAKLSRFTVSSKTKI